MTEILGLGIATLLATTAILEPPATVDETTPAQTTPSASTLASVAPTADEETVQEYNIKMTRVFHVGQQLHVHAEGSMERSVIQVLETSEQPLEASQMSVIFDANAVVLEVDQNGQPKSMAYQVKTCTASQGEETMVLAEAGAKLTARQDGNKTVFEINGQPASETTSEALHIVAALEGYGITDDAVFGTDKTRVIGESWSMNSENFVKLLEQQTGKQVQPSSISGLTTLVEFKPYQGEPCLVLHSHVSTESFLPGMETLPPTLEMSDARMTAMRLGFFPINQSLPAMSESSRVDVEATLTGQLSPDLPDGQIRVRVVRVAEVQTQSLEGGTNLATVTEPAGMPED